MVTYMTLKKDDFLKLMMKEHPTGFSKQGLEALFTHLSEEERDIGEEFDFCPKLSIAEWSQSTIESALNEFEASSLSDLKKMATIIKVNKEEVIYAER